VSARSWLLAVVLLVFGVSTLHATEEAVEFERFGTVHLYSETSTPEHVVLFVSGDGGWNQGVVDMARDLAQTKSLVAGIDINHYLAELAKSDETCSYPAADFEALSQFLQKSRGYAVYQKPVLVGYSSGATLVYAVVAQAPPTTFKGALSLGFCPDLMLTKPLCKGSGLEWGTGAGGKGFNFRPATHLRIPWIAMQGEIDQVCSPAATRTFVQKVPGAEVVMLPNVGHGYSVPRNWLPQFRDAFARIVAKPDLTDPPKASVESLADLPLHEVTARGAQGTTFAVHITGDGGYGVTDKGVTEGLAEHGISTVVLNSLHYFWKARTPDQTAADVVRILRYYLTSWKKTDVILVGYSRGADVLPFVVNRLPADLRGRVRELVLLGAGKEAGFELNLTGWLHHTKTYPVLPEIEKLRGMHIVCFYGTEDKDALGPRLDAGLAKTVAVNSGHRFGSNYDGIVHMIVHETGVDP
jgi:type IV secretory pathway VirJ component